jgi:hypothetical protein
MARRRGDERVGRLSTEGPGVPEQLVQEMNGKTPGVVVGPCGEWPAQADADPHVPGCASNVAPPRGITSREHHSHPFGAAAMPGTHNAPAIRLHARHVLPPFTVPAAAWGSSRDSSSFTPDTARLSSYSPQTRRLVSIRAGCPDAP